MNCKFCSKEIELDLERDWVHKEYEKKEDGSDPRMCRVVATPSKKIKKDTTSDKICCHCHKQLSYSEKYDSYYCSHCNYWIETICPDKDCQFCKDRPKYPK